MMKSKIKKWEDACKSEKVDSKALPDVSMIPEEHQKAIVSLYKLIIIIQAVNRELNGGKRWYPNWNDSNEWKYFYWPQIDADAKNPSGFGFSYSDCVSAYSSASAGSRLCSKSSEAALYVGNTWPELYKEYFIYMGLIKPEVKKKK